MNGSSSKATSALATREALPTSVITAWSTLTKSRITAMVMFSAFIGALLAAGPGASLIRLAEAALWIGCVAASSCVFNQVLERDIDRLMIRTMQRPLVTGRVRLRDAIFGAGLLALAGTLGLALRFNVLCALLALATLLAYVLVYTPLKRVSTLNTAIGAIPGAMPPLLGYVALSGHVAHWGWYLFAVVFAWQFPHFLAIAWMYRDDYARAGLKMLPSVPDTRGMAGRQALLYSLMLVPVSLLPALRGEAGWVYATGALVLGLAYVASSALFACNETPARARAVLFTSLAYLPALFSIVLMDPLVRIASTQGVP